MDIKDVDPETLSGWLEDGKAILVDVREAAEHAAERIAQAHHLPLSAFDPARLPDHDGKIVVYHCASGGRTSRFGQQLAAAARAAHDVFHMDGGIAAWKNAGLATEA